MKFFAMDLHISVIADFKTANPDIEVVDWCLSSHAWVMKRKQDYPKVINPHTWMNLNEQMISDFQKEYDSFLSSFDGFITGHVSAFAMIYEKYNKPILMINTCRYDLPFCWTNNHHMVRKLNECLQRLMKKTLLIPTSNNHADRLYTYKGCGIITQIIPSLCLYTNIEYSPIRNKFLCYSKNEIDNPLIINKSELGKHEWSVLGEFKGIIHFPYEVSTMSMFEHYSAGIPLFLPSKTFWKSNSDIQSVREYWGNRMPEYFGELRNTDTWIDLSDIYLTFKGPNIYYFNSIPHLFSLLEQFEYVAYDMNVFRDEIRLKWKNIVSNNFQ